MRWIEFTARGEDYESRCFVALESLAQGGERLGGYGKDEFGRPQRAEAFRSDGAGADKHGIGERAQQAHHEAVRLIPSADDASRGGGAALEGGDAIDRADEVGVDRTIADCQSTIVDFGQQRRQLPGRQVIGFENPVEPIQLKCPLVRDPAILRNSSRSCGTAS